MKEVTTEQAYDRAVEMLSGEDEWPDLQPRQCAFLYRETRYQREPVDYIAMMAVVMYIVCSGNRWPPLSPKEFGAGWMPGIKKIFWKCVNPVKKDLAR